jgi:hypothetical protein
MAHMPIWRNLRPPFPLTPALSPRERVGVRGNKASVLNWGDFCNWLPRIAFVGVGVLNMFRAKRNASADSHTEDLLRGAAVYSNLQEAA